MGEKIITVYSNASFDQYPENKISNFRNKLYSPISLYDGAYEVALLECTYNATRVLVYENEFIGYVHDKTTWMLHAPFSITSLDQLFKFIQEKTGVVLTIDFYGFVNYTVPDGILSQIKFSKRLLNILGLTEIRYRETKMKPDDFKHASKASAKPRRTPIHYVKGDLIMHAPQAGAKIQSLSCPISHDDFDTMMSLCAEQKTVFTGKQIGPYKWRITVPKADKLSFINCSESDVSEKDGVITYTVEKDKADVFFSKGEIIFTFNEKNYTCEEDVVSFDQVLKLWQTHLNKHILFETFDNKFEITTDTKTCNDPYISAKIKMSDKMQIYLGFGSKPINIYFNQCQMKSYTGCLRPMINMGQTQLLIYSDLIHPQHIGDTVAPLLRSLQIQYDGAEHVFPSPMYFPVCRDNLDVIHVYIMCEDGEPPPFELGTFSATLSIRKRVS